MRSNLPPLSDAELDVLSGFLADCSPFDMDGLFGVLHAVSVAPGLIVPSTWLPLVLPDGLRGLDEAEAKRLLRLVLRLYNEVLDAVNVGGVIAPSPEDVDACDSFAEGYVAGAELDPAWIDDFDRWSFAVGMAYLGGRLDLLPPEALATFEAAPSVKDDLRRELAAMVVATHDSFLEIRRDLPSTVASPRTSRVGRNEPCPCGSGKKFKRCCVDRATAMGAD